MARIRKIGKKKPLLGTLPSNPGTTLSRKEKRREKPLVILVDSSHLGYQSAFAMGDMSYQGEGTGVIYGFLTQVLQLSRRFFTDRFIFCWDSKESKRKKIYPQYKGNRNLHKLSEEEQEQRRDIYRQFDLLREWVLPTMGFGNVWMQEGYEADDLIAGVCVSEKIKSQILIISSDEDLWQLIRPGVAMSTSSSKKLMNWKLWQQAHEITPKQWAEVKAIAGCSSDNIQGVPGVGELTAEKYLMGTLPETYKAYQKIQQSQEQIEANRVLVTLPLNGVKIPKIHPNSFDPEQLKWVWNRYGFQSFYWDDDLKEGWDWFLMNAQRK